MSLNSGCFRSNSITLGLNVKSSNISIVDFLKFSFSSWLFILSIQSFHESSFFFTLEKSGESKLPELDTEKKMINITETKYFIKKILYFFY